MASIVIIGPAYPLRGGGMSTFNERMAREFLKNGHQVSIYTFSLQYPGFLFPGKSQYAEEEPPADLNIKVKINSINPLNWFRVGNELKKRKPDIVIIRYWMPFMAPCLGTIASKIRKNRHTKIIAITDNVIPHEKRPGDRWLTKFFIHRMHAFVAMSDTVINDLKTFGVEAYRYALCLHPLYDNYGKIVDQKKARKFLGLPPENHVILFFGFIREYKGLDLLIKAFSHEKIRKASVNLLVAGEFYTKPEPYFRLADQLQVNDKIIWHNNFISNELVKYYFSASDLVVQPYKSATQSGVTQVAYHFEIPMVVTRVGGLPEMVTHGKSGYVVDPDPKEIALAIDDYFSNNKKDYFIEGLRKEKARFSWDVFTETLLRLADLNK